MNDNLKIIAEFIDEASAGIKKAKAELEALSQAQTGSARASTAGAAAATKTIGPLQAVGAAVAGWAAALGVAALAWQGLMAALEEADKFDDLSEKTGIAASGLRDLSFAAKMSGTSLDAVIGAMNKLGKAADLSDEAATKQAQTFKQLGITTTGANGQLKSTEQLMMEVADKFKGLQDGPEKSAAAFRLFGGEAKNMLPFLNQGSEEIQKLKKESQELAGVSPEAFDAFAKGVGKMNDNIDKVKTISNGFFTQLTSELIPVLNIMAEAFINSAKEGGLLRQIMNGLVGAFNFLIPFVKAGAEAFSALVLTLQVAGKTIGLVMAAIATVASGGGVAGLKQVWGAYTDDVKASAQAHVDFSEKINGTYHEAAKLTDGVKKVPLKSLVKDAKEATSALDEFIKTMKAARYSYDFVPDNANALDAARARDIWAQTAALQKDIAAGMDKSRALAKYRAADAESSLRDEQRRFEAGIKALDAADLELKVKEKEMAAIKFENSLVGKSADERERLVQARKDELALNKQWADTVAGNQQMAEQLWKDTEAVQARSAALKKASEDAAIQNEIFDNSLSSAQDNFTRRIQLALQMYEAGKISLADFTQYQQEQFDSLLSKTKDTTTKSTVFWEEAAKGMQDAMQTFFYDIMQGNMTNIVDDFQKMISKMVAQALAANLGEKLFGTGMGKGGAGGYVGAAASWLGSLFGGARATGGPVSAGKAYLVGEKRPELFVPDTSGTILPSVDDLGAGPGVTVQMHVSAMDAKSFMSHMSGYKRELATMVQDATYQYNLGR